MILTLSVSQTECWKSGVNNEVSTNSATIPTTTIIPTAPKTEAACLGGSIPNGNGGCYSIDTCKVLFGPCDCENGNTLCCNVDQCATTTESFPINCGPGSRNRRCAGPPTTTIAAVTAHNKCQKK